jgi:uncharacterized protein YpbB
MTQVEMLQSSTTPEFLNYLETREKDVLETKSISGLYEVLDMLLILDLDEIRINKVYEVILTVAFEQIEKRLQTKIKLKLYDNSSNDKFYIRAFYEHSIEKWSRNDTKGAKELFFVLSQIIDDKTLLNAINIKLLACNDGIDMEHFYDTKILHQQTIQDEVYGYFLVDFTFNVDEYLKKNINRLEAIQKELKSLVEV